MTGDVVNIYGKSFWHNNTCANPNNTTYLINTAINSFIAAFAGTPIVAATSEGTASALEGASTTSTGVYNWVTTGVPATPATVPKAYVNWILFNEQFVPISSNCGYDMVSATADNVKSHSDAVSIGTSGYLYVYCSNESNVDVYFDNIQVIQTRGPLLETNSYYGFGLTMAGISDKAIKTNYVTNKFRYNKKELQNQEFSNGNGLEWYDYGARMYDDQIGRWIKIDPFAFNGVSYSPYNFDFNNPILLVDLTGKWPKPVHHALLDAAFGPNSPFAKTVTSSQLVALKKGSDNADGFFNGNQNDSRQYIHGMKPSKMTKDQAIQAAHDWISEKVMEFVKTGDFETLGEGLHTIMDITSPAHRNEKGEPLEYNLGNYSSMTDHSNKEDPDEIKKHNGKDGYITVESMNKRWQSAEGNMRDMLQLAITLRAAFIKQQEEQKKRNQRNKFSQTQEQQRQDRGSIL